MNHELFTGKLQHIVNLSLPALDAHKKMAPAERLPILDELSLNKPNAKNAAVMMLFYPKLGKTHLAFIKRNSYPGVHSSQIAFPGGKVEVHDVGFESTALRETEEEIGVGRHHIQVVRSLTTVYIPPSNFLVHPFVGFTVDEPRFKLQEEEVSGLIEAPLHQVMDDAVLVTKVLQTSYAKSIEVPAFEIEGQIIWGATAMMLSELKDVLKMVL